MFFPLRSMDMDIVLSPIENGWIVKYEDRSDEDNWQDKEFYCETLTLVGLKVAELDKKSAPTV